jgi:CRP-like cAMP-binding protein
MGRHPRWYTATTESELMTLRGDHEALFDVLEDHFDVAMELIGAMSHGALNAIQQLAERGAVTGSSGLGPREDWTEQDRATAGASRISRRVTPEM